MFSNLRYVLLSLVCFVLLLAAATFVLGSSAKSVQYLITYVVTTLALTALALLQKRDPRLREGWRYLSPSAMEWLALVMSFALTVLFLWVYYFVGSARADAESQMFALKLLIAGFGAGTGAVFFTSFASEVRWNDDCIEQRRPFGATRTIKLSDIVAGGLNPWTHAIWIAASDGTVIRFSSYANGAEALARTIFKPDEASGSDTRDSIS